MRKTLNRVASIATSIAMVSTMLLAGAPAYAAGPATGMKDSLTREATSVSATHTVTMTLPAPGLAGDTLTLDYSAFTVVTAGSAVCAAGGTPTTAVLAGVITVSGTCTTGLLTLTFTATNPATAGGRTIALGGTAGITGSYTVSINSGDQIIVTATVAPTVTFQVTTDHTGANANCLNGSSLISGDHTPATNGGVVELGTLSPLAMASSDAPRVGSSGSLGYNGTDSAGTPDTYVAGANVQHICTFVSTSSSTGYNLTVTSQNGGLFNAAAAQYINGVGGGAEVADSTSTAAAVTIAPGTEAYIMCLSTSDSPKIDTTTPAGSPLVGVAEFAPSPCNATSTSGGELTTETQTIGGEAVGPVQESTADWLIKATINATTGTGAYTDALTFIATSTF